MAKKNLKNKAIKLRKSGKSYSEILKEVSVARSTLSLWLRSVNLSKKQKQILTLKKLEAARRGGEKKKLIRIEKSKKIIEKAKSEVGKITDREKWLAGIMLYWAEGAKQKESNISVAVRFSNSDPEMLSFFIQWLKKYLEVPDDDLVFEIFVHEKYKDQKEYFVDYWSKKLNYPTSKFNRIYYKKHKIKTKRKYSLSNYHGQLLVSVRKSTSLNRKITGWIEGFNLYCPVV